MGHDFFFYHTSTVVIQGIGVAIDGESVVGGGGGGEDSCDLSTRLGGTLGCLLV